MLEKFCFLIWVHNTEFNLNLISFPKNGFIERPFSCAIQTFLNIV